MRYFIPLLIGVALAIAGCPDPTGQNTQGNTPTGDETTAPQIGGGVGSSSGSTSSPTPSSPGAIAPYATSVSISPSTLTLSVPPQSGSGDPAGYPTSAQLSAVVTMTDGSASGVTWASLSPEVATVNSTGLVSVVGPGSGSGPWNVIIQATSTDGNAVGYRTVTVTAEGDVNLSVQ